MSERPEIYYKIAVDRLREDESEDKKEKEKEKPKWQSLFAEERYAEPSTRLDLQRRKVVQWRLRDRTKTVSVALVLCLNIGVDPPDVIKTSPCARQECWIDPMSLPPQKAVDTIGKTLQLQYERWQPRAKYKMCLDPTIESVKKLCVSLRRNAKEERILFHYNGHGVPKPTPNGEIWVFNKNYTQYIPLSLYELQHWVGSPSIYVFDCNAAGLIVKTFLQFAEQRRLEMERNQKATGQPQERVQEDHILLAACSANETLPTNPNLPADVFTACLTTPIKIALKWFVSQTIISGVTYDLVDKIPGKLNDRRTPLGELNWIFTAVTDTIAWNVLPRPLFQKLFRQDLLVASLFRNFLLAERIMRSARCTTVSYPKLPPTYNHPMWQAWDLACDHCLSQLPKLIANPSMEFKNCSFFAEQLTAFEVWLEFGTEDKKPPEQLPIVLQVLLSQQHRLRALILLARFLDLGPWAVNQALSIGIFPYVLKLLQSPAQELREVLVFIWAKILALDKSCQLDLVKDNGQFYFITVLSNTKVPAVQRTQAAFILSVICNNCRPGQSACLNARLLQICLSQLNEPDPMLRKWIVLALAKLWENYEDAKWAAIRESAQEKLCVFLTDPVPEVRAAAVYALGTFIGGGTPAPALGQPAPNNTDAQRAELRTKIETQLGVTLAVVTFDASPMVRKELIVTFANLVNACQANFIEEVKKILRAEIKAQLLAARRRAMQQLAATKGKGKVEMPALPVEEEEDTTPSESIYEFFWKIVLNLTTDPYPPIAKLANALYNQIKNMATAQDNDLRRNSEALQPPGAASSMRSKSPARSGSPKGRGKKAEKRYHSFSNLLSLRKGDQPEEEEDDDESFDTPIEEIRSTLYDWSCAYFSAPLNRPNTEDETSPEYSQRKWRQQRNEHMIKEAKAANDKALQMFGCKKLENEIAILENDSGQMISLLLFHPFENILVVSDEQDGINVWNWEEGVRINSFSNCNPPGTRITSLTLINEYDIAMIAAGSDDGVVRIWNGIYSHDSCRLVTAWKALAEQREISRGTGAGLIIDWQQSSELLFASGNVDVIRVWDLNRELSVQNIQTLADSPVTCLTTDKAEGQRLVMAGCADGSVRLFDIRQPGGKYAAITTWAEHKGCVINVFKPRCMANRIISGATNGTVKFWDPRGAPQSVRTINAHSSGLMTAFAVHDQAPLIATGSQDQRIKVFNFNGEELSVIRYHDGFLGQRIGPVSALSFHPYHVLLGAGATDSLVSIYAGETFKTNA